MKARGAEADKERTVQDLGKYVGLTFERSEPRYNEEYLEWIPSQKWKSCDTYDSRGRQVRVKVQPTHTWTKRTQWSSHSRETTSNRAQTGQRTVCGGMASLAEWQALDPSKVQKAVTVMVRTKWYVNGDPESLSIMTRKEHKLVDCGLEQLVRLDETVWPGIQGQRPPLPAGCHTFLVVFFSITAFQWNLALDMAASVSFSDIPAGTETGSTIRWRRTPLGSSSADVPAAPESLKRGT